MVNLQDEQLVGNDLCLLVENSIVNGIEIVAARTVFASCGSSMAAGKIEQLVGNGSCRFGD